MTITIPATGTTPAPRIVAYRRVSTQKQGQSGLGLEAQAEAIAGYAGRIGATVTATFTEVESGKRNDRPELHKAIHLAKVTGATLVIAKLDRLSRNAAFLLTMRDAGVEFVAADMPDANSLTIGIMALVAQQEREATSKRTKEALEAARRRGVKLGNPNGAAALLRAGKGNGASVARHQLWHLLTSPLSPVDSEGAAECSHGDVDCPARQSVCLDAALGRVGDCHERHFAPASPRHAE